MRAVYPSLQFKEPKMLEEFFQIDSRLQFIIEDLSRFCKASGYDFIVTDILSSPSDDARLGRVSNTHLEGRAVDIRTKSWPKEFITKFIKFAEAAHGKSGAISKTDGKRRLVVYHDVGHGAHCHIQVSRRKS